ELLNAVGSQLIDVDLLKRIGRAAEQFGIVAAGPLQKQIAVKNGGGAERLGRHRQIPAALKRRRRDISAPPAHYQEFKLVPETVALAGISRRKVGFLLGGKSLSTRLSPCARQQKPNRWHR